MKKIKKIFGQVLDNRKFVCYTDFSQVLDERKGITMNEFKTTIYEQLQQFQMIMHRAMFHNFGKMRNPHRGQGRVLAILKLKPVISQKELTYLLDMSKQAVAELIMKLERNNYITREPSEDDKRIMTIRLTEAGAEAADDVDDSTPDFLNILDCLNDDELSNFSEYLARIIKQYEIQFTGSAHHNHDHHGHLPFKKRRFKHENNYDDGD